MEEVFQGTFGYRYPPLKDEINSQHLHEGVKVYSKRKTQMGELHMNNYTVTTFKFQMHFTLVLFYLILFSLHITCTLVCM